LVQRISIAAYFALLLLAAVAAYRTVDRDWNWDGLAYIACAAAWSERDPVALHASVYREARSEMPAEAFELLTAGNPYRADLASNPVHFLEQLPFYDGKVLYIELMFGLHGLGASYVGGMKSLSAAGFFALGVVFFLWTRAYFPALPAAILSAAFMLSAPVWNLARMFSPDALSVAMVTAALYAFFVMAPARPASQRSVAALLGLALLSAAVFVRNDTLLLAALVIGYLALASRSPLKIKRAQGAVLIVLLIGSVLALGHFGGGYGWRMSFYHGLVQRVPAPAETAAPAISPAEYLRAAARSAREALDASSLALFVFITTAALLLLKRGTLMRDALLLSLGFSALRIIVYPGFEERYYVSTYAVAALCLISALPAYRRSGGGPDREPLGAQF
jgi:hypothetical protein